MKEILVGLSVMAVAGIPLALFFRRHGFDTGRAVAMVFGLGAMAVMVGVIAWLVGAVVLGALGG